MRLVVAFTGEGQLEPDPGREVVEARATRNWVGADGIVRSRIRQGCDFVLADSVEALNATRSLVTTLPVPVLVDVRGVRTASRESRQYWESAEARAVLSAMAILVASPVSRVIASFFIRLVRPGFNVQIFSDEEAATQWLRAGSP